MDAIELRKTFLNYFKNKGHIIVPSSSLLPDDPSVLFTTAGMQQFKPYYTGELDPLTAVHSGFGKPLGARRAASAQKCMRTSDIEEVGDAAHLTFFEMLGNFSFGDYFKEEAIAWAYDFLSNELKLPPDYVTVFEGDNDIAEDNDSFVRCLKLGVEVRKAGKEDNFWGPTGSEGPCGPTVEFYVDGIEVWNLVFNEYYCALDKTFKKLATPGVDTGAGLERMLMALEKKKSVFETSIFSPLMEVLGGKNEKAARIVADHLRAATFLIADGIIPSNLERGYIVRRLIRRAVRAARQGGFDPSWWQNGLGVLREIFKEPYPEILDALVEEAVGEEIEKFSKTLERGLREFTKAVEEMEKGATLSGRDTFDLYETYGFPIELTEELAHEKGFLVDHAGFKAEQKKHQKVSRAGQEKKFGGHGLLLDTGELKASTPDEVEKATRLHTATHLLQSALRKVLGAEVKQMGSDITAERLRFDFSFPRKLTPEELENVSGFVNAMIRKDLSRTIREMPYEDALREGALAFFKGKYPPLVKVFSFGNFSKEVCGGPHVESTGKVGTFKILKEEASSAGVRRIRAVVE